jgi:hypothetical protein
MKYIIFIDRDDGPMRTGEPIEFDADNDATAKKECKRRLLKEPVWLMACLARPDRKKGELVIVHQFILRKAIPRLIEMGLVLFKNRN